MRKSSGSHKRPAPVVAVAVDGGPLVTVGDGGVVAGGVVACGVALGLVAVGGAAVTVGVGVTPGVALGGRPLGVPLGLAPAVGTPVGLLLGLGGGALAVGGAARYSTMLPSSPTATAQSRAGAKRP